MMMGRSRFLLSLLLLAGPANASPTCAQNLGGLRVLLADAAFPLRWSETTMDDGRPLVLSILEREGTLFLSFMKTGEGLWAEGSIALCAKGGDFEARLDSQRMRLGPAAHWAMRYSMANGAEFTFTRLAGSRLRVYAPGWSGTFAARE